MQTPISITFIFTACSIVALLFVVRLVAALFSGKVRNQIQKHPIVHAIWACLAFIGFVAVTGGINPSSLTGGTRGRYMRQQDHYAEAFKAGDTNVPLFEMDWFAPTVHFCRVSQVGKGSARRDVGYAIQDGVSISLDETNLQALIETLNRLPTPPKHTLPIERQIVVGCIRSNQWVSAVYDRANIPSELDRISGITGAYLPWYIPDVSAAASRPVARATDANFYCMATETPIAVSAIYGFLRIWKLDNFFGKKSYKFQLEGGIPMQLFRYEQPIAISPDGKTIAVATENNLCVVEWQKRNVIWKADTLEQEGYSNCRHIVIGEGGRTLFTAGAHTIERWDLFSGQKLGVLSVMKTNFNVPVQRLIISRNGKVLLAGFGWQNLRPNAFKIWDAGKDKPSLVFEEKEGTEANLSPDGEWIALSRFGTENLVLLKWRTGERKEVWLRNSRSIDSVYWSPDGKRLAAYVDTYPPSIIVYDASLWKPIASWSCGRIGESSEFFFGSDGLLYQIRNTELNALDVPKLKRTVDN